MPISWRGFWPPCHSSPYPVKEVTLALVNTSHLVIVDCNNTILCFNVTNATFLAFSGWSLAVMGTLVGLQRLVRGRNAGTPADVLLSSRRPPGKYVCWQPGREWHVRHEPMSKYGNLIRWFSKLFFKWLQKYMYIQTLNILYARVFLMGFLVVCMVNGGKISSLMFHQKSLFTYICIGLL